MNKIAYTPQKCFGETPSLSSFPLGTELAANWSCLPPPPLPLLLEIDDIPSDAMGRNVFSLRSATSLFLYIRRIRAREFERLGVVLKQHRFGAWELICLVFESYKPRVIP
ncbi:uncharacterized protein DS421_17g578180 [Arachis hypogaea]|nr:uncharacterized protein DS421_17g578180 [Arachis hypogaea]